MKKLLFSFFGLVFAYLTVMAQSPTNLKQGFCAEHRSDIKSGIELPKDVYAEVCGQNGNLVVTFKSAKPRGFVPIRAEYTVDSGMAKLISFDAIKSVKTSSKSVKKLERLAIPGQIAEIDTASSIPTADGKNVAFTIYPKGADPRVVGKLLVSKMLKQLPYSSLAASHQIAAK